MHSIQLTVVVIILGNVQLNSFEACIPAMYSVQHIVTYPRPYHGTFMCILFSVQDGISPLFIASEKGHTDIVDLVLNAGADVHQTNKVYTSFVHLHVLSNLRARKSCLEGKLSQFTCSTCTTLNYRYVMC